MRASGWLIRASAAVALVVIAPRVDRTVLAQNGGSQSGERVRYPIGSQESTAAIMAREHDQGAASGGSAVSSLTVAPGAAFTAIRFVDTSAIQPDGSAAAGITQFVAIANGRLRSFTKSGAADGVLNVKPATFFASVKGSGNPLGGRVRFDRSSGRWFITMATDVVPARILIASSGDATITAGTVWSFSAFDDTFPGSDCRTDAPTLGVDASALYIGANQFCTNGTAYRGSSAWVVRKTSVLDGATAIVTAFHDLTGSVSGPGPFAPQGVNNDDAGAAAGYFIGVDNSAFGSLILRRVSSPGGTPTISANIQIPVAATSLPLPVRHKGNTGGANGYLSPNDDRLGTVYMRDGRAWASHTIAVNESGATSGATRNGVRWYEIGSLDGTPAVLQTGTLNDTSAPGSVDARNYFNASIATSTRGRTVVGFSAAGTNEFVNAGVADRAAADAVGTLQSPAIYTSASAAFNPPDDPGGAAGRSWGGYSETVMDGCDGTTIWSLQQFVEATNSYALQAVKVRAEAPPTPMSVTPSTVQLGISAIDVVVTGSPQGTGSAWSDAPVGFACRAAASIPGVTVNSVTVNSATQVTLNISTVNSISSVRDVTIVNADGQTATGAGLLTLGTGVPPTGPGAPFGVMDTPAANANVSGEMGVTGWALDDGGIASVDVFRDAVAGEAPGYVLLGSATLVRGARPDVQAAYPTYPGADVAGWGLLVLTNMLPNGGNGTFRLSVWARDRGGLSTLIGTRTVVGVNSTSILPFGTIDTPGQGATVSGTIINFGWALTPQPKMVPTDGSTIDVYIDGVFVGHPVYNQFRSDIAGAFPGLKNSNGAVGAFVIDTTTLTDGMHTIGWLIRDDSGAVAGVGSRFFHVRNGS